MTPPGSTQTLRLVDVPPPRPVYRADTAQIEECAPAELTACHQWVAWRFDWNAQRGEWAKVPYNPHTGNRAQSNEPETWGSFDQAKTRFERLPNAAGVGFCFSPTDDEFVGIDLDDSIAEHGGLKDWASPIAETINSYTEVSPSGTGVKIFTRGTKPPKGRVKKYHDGQIETYGSGRWFAVTGNRVEDYSYDVERRHDEYARLWSDLLAPEINTAPPLAAVEASSAVSRVSSTMIDVAKKLLDHAPQAGELDGSKRLYGWACRGVEAGADDATIVAAVRYAALAHPFKTAWTDADIVKRVRDAEKVAQRGSQSPEAPLLPTHQTIGELMDACPDLRPVTIDGILRVGETMNIISAPKIGKSWLTHGLALSVATGERWLGTYDVTQGDVLLIDNELHKETLARRLNTIANAMGIQHAAFRDRVVVESLRGRLRDWMQLDSYFRAIEPGRFRLIVCDAFYRFMPKGSDENDNGTMAAVYNMIDRYAEMTGSSFVLIHHSSKGIQSGKAVTDVGAGAGAQSRATDSHVVLRHHEEDDVVVLDAAVRSFKPIEPICLKWNYPLWVPSIESDPTQLRKENRPRREKAPLANPVPDAEPLAKPEPWSIDRFVSTFITDQPQDKAAIMVDAKFAKVPARDAANLFQAALGKGKIFEHTYADDRRRKRYANVEQSVLDTGAATNA